MNTEQKLFGSYLGLSVKQRIYHLMKNYHYRDRYTVSSLSECLTHGCAGIFL